MEQAPQLSVLKAPCKDSYGNTLKATLLSKCTGAHLWRLYVAIEMTHDNMDCSGCYQFMSSTELFAPGSIITEAQIRECMERGNNIGNGHFEKILFPFLFKPVYNN